MRAIYRANIATLTSRGVALALWSVATPRAIFPQRRIGALEAGFETNLLVLQAVASLVPQSATPCLPPPSPFARRS